MRRQEKNALFALKTILPMMMVGSISAAYHQEKKFPPHTLLAHSLAQCLYNFL
jgi:hypothetical protein